jgi:chromosome segregation ATPase
MGLFTKIFELYYKRRLARKEAAELSVRLGRLNKEINELKADIKRLSDERDERMEQLIVILKEPISILENEYNTTISEQKTDLIIDGAVLKHFGDIQNYMTYHEESALFPALKRIIKRSKGHITLADAKSCLLKRIDGMKPS